MTSMKYSALLLAGVGVTAAVSISFDLGNPLGSTGLSSTCQSALLSVSSNSEASSCINVPGLAAILTLPANTSAVPALNTWLQGMCRADPCSNDTINAISTNITNGCQSDISSTGVSQSTLQTIVQDIPKFYPTVRSIACLKTESNNTLCASSTLLDVENFVGHPISTNDAMSSISQIVATSLPASLTCTGCTQAAFDTFQADQAMLAANPTLRRSISRQCGANFLSAPQPSDVVEGTASAAPTGSVAKKLSKNAAFSAALTSGALWGLVATTMFSVVAGSYMLA